MITNTSSTDALIDRLNLILSNYSIAIAHSHDTITLTCSADTYRAVCFALRDATGLQFEQLMDLCGVDYSAYPAWQGRRYAVVLHLLSLSLNQRLRVRVFAEDDAFPIVDSVSPVWAVADWYEREAFDLFGILFDGHPDLRRILTDYGFIGHPFRKDFPMIGTMEVRYDPESKRVVYQAVSIDERNNVPRIIRHEGKHG